MARKIEIKILTANKDGSARGRTIELKPKNDCLTLYDNKRDTAIFRVQNVDGVLMLTYYPKIDKTTLKREHGC